MKVLFITFFSLVTLATATKAFISDEKQATCLEWPSEQLDIPASQFLDGLGQPHFLLASNGPPPAVKKKRRDNNNDGANNGGGTPNQQGGAVVVPHQHNPNPLAPAPNPNPAPNNAGQNQGQPAPQNIGIPQPPHQNQWGVQPQVPQNQGNPGQGHQQGGHNAFQNAPVLNQGNPGQGHQQGGHNPFQNAPVLNQGQVQPQAAQQIPRINRDYGTKQTYSKAIVQPFNPNAPADMNYQGQIVTSPKTGKPQLKEGGLLMKRSWSQPRPLGRMLGDGFNSTVYKSNSDPNRVNKIVNFEHPGMTPQEIVQGAKSITDQDGGREILKDIKNARPDSLFRVAEREGRVQIIETQAADGRYRFAFSREENIAKQITNKRGEPVFVTNAAERIAERGRPMTEGEALTLALVMRDINSYGVVWTDNKLQNLDIVPDNSSLTNYRVVFFDFDGFRPVRGGTRVDRNQAARELQKAFDVPSQGNTGFSQLEGRLREANRRVYPGPAGEENPYLGFDDTAFGTHLGVLATPRANIDMGPYLVLNSLLHPFFQKEVNRYNKERGRKVQVRQPPSYPQGQ